MVIIHNKCVHQSELLDFASNNTDLGFIKSLRFTVKKKKKDLKRWIHIKRSKLTVHTIHMFTCYINSIYMCVYCTII